MSVSMQGQSTVGYALGRFAAELTIDQVPEEVVEKLRCNLLHDVSCLMGAHSVGPELWPLFADRRPEEATFLCDGRRVGADYAAFVNAQLMHARAQDDTHFAAKTHVGSAVIPAVLAIAERDGLDGAAFATAVLVGCEVAAAVGERLAVPMTARGFRATPVFGTLGAAAGVASALKLDADAAADAIAIASSFSAGLNQMWIDGTSEYRIELGMAARNGITAAQLAQGGFKGAPHWYEGKAGFALAFADETEPDLSDWRLGKDWRVKDVTYKPYPVCAITQSEVQVAIDLATEHDIDAADVTGVRVYLNTQDRTYPGTLNKGPFNDVGASLMSAEYCVAMALKHRTATLAGLREFEDETIHRLVSITEVLPDDDLPNLGGGVEVQTASGQTYRGRLVPNDATYGWDWQGVLANIRRMEPELAVDRARLDELEQAVKQVTTLRSVGPIVRGTLP